MTTDLIPTDRPTPEECARTIREEIQRQMERYNPDTHEDPEVAALIIWDRLKDLARLNRVFRILRGRA